MGLSELSAFVHMLKEKGIIDFNIDEFNHRLIAQKCVFLSEFFGWSHGYPYNLYIRGPYSKDLADDYYKLENAEISEPINDLEPSFNSSGFINLVSGKDEDWLESAATLMSIYCYNAKSMNDFKAAGFALSRTKEIKHKI